MSLKERIAAARQEQPTGGLKATIAARRVTQPVPEPVAEPEDESSWLDRVAQLGQGMMLGFSDEAGIAIAAAAQAAFGESDKSYSEIYRDMKGLEEEQRAEFVETHPGEALALNLAGGIATGGVGLSRALGTTGAKQAGTMAKLLRGSGVGATEGALAGFGAADGDLEQRFEGAGQGAMWGAALPAAFSATGGAGKKALDVMSRRRVAQELGAGEKFIPLNIADAEGGVGEFYRSLEVKGFGIKIPEQTERVLQRSRAQIDKTKTAAQEIKRTTEASRKRGKQFALNEVEEINYEAQKVADRAAKTATRQTREQAAEATQDVKTVATQNIEVSEDAFRRQAIDSAIPPGINDEARAAIQQADPQGATDIIADAWREGFADVKGRAFSIDPEDVIEEITADVGGRTGMDQYLKEITAGLDSTLTARTADGVISGDDLMNARNQLRIRASAAADEGGSAVHRAALNRAANRIDDVITGQLDDEGRVLFEAEKTAWGNYRTLGRAGKKAITKKRGAFDQDDWLSAQAQGRTRQALRGKAPLQQEAYAAQQTQKAAADQAEDAATRIQTQTKDALEEVGLTRETAKRASALEKTRKQQAIRDAAKGKMPLEETGLGYRAGVEAEQAFKHAMPSKESVLGRLGATMAMGAPAFRVAPIMGSLASGVGMAKGLSTEAAQRAMAGQTKPQEIIAELLRRYKGSATQRAVGDVATGLRRGAIVSGNQ